MRKSQYFFLRVFGTQLTLLIIERMSLRTSLGRKSTNARVGALAMIPHGPVALQHEVGLSSILAELSCGGLIPHQRVLTAMRLLCEAVKPRVTQ